MKNYLPEILAGLAVLAALLLVVHQKITHHFWFNMGSAWHHEAIEACFAALAVGLLLGKYLGKLDKL